MEKNNKNFLSNIRIDSHKLIYHPKRVSDFLDNRVIYPIYTEISLTNRCNIRCTFCALDYRQINKKDIDFERLKILINEFNELGIKSICFAGEGEPLLYKNINTILDLCKRNNIDTAIATNGTLLNDEHIKNFCENLTWIKFSVNAFSKNKYKLIHRTKEKYRDNVFNNIEKIVNQKKKIKSKITIGVQAVLLPENASEILDLAVYLKEKEVDYFVIKPFNYNMNTKNTKYKDIDYNKYIELAAGLNDLNTNKFNVFFREQAFKKVIENKRYYKSCYGVNFFALIYSDGNIYTCSPHSGKEEYCYGNIYENTFKEIWESDRRKKIVEKLKKKINNCMIGCRLDEINKYLWELKHPGHHVNFI